jgi:Di-haem oxidoreductase, putative peroxidase
VRHLRTIAGAALLLLLGGALFNVSAVSKTRKPRVNHETALFRQGRAIFRNATFGDEQFWTGVLQLQKVIEGSKHGGLGPGVSPKTALAVGLKVDAQALPKKIVRAIKRGKVNLNDPATTLALIKLNAVVGVRGHFNRAGNLKSIGVTCAICHSTVNNSFAPGIGKRLDGWPNRDLNVGAIISLSPNLAPVASLLGTDVATVKKVLAAWGPGKFDAELFLDGKGFRPDGKTAATLIPPAFGLSGVNLHTYEGWGSIPYWNAFVANLEMHGQGNFYDPRLDDANKFPVAARNHFGHTTSRVDKISGKLPALQYYQLSLAAPKPPRRSFNHAAARRGKTLFDGAAKCASCHVPGRFTEPGWDMHKPSEICTDAFQADRSPDGMYRTTPLKGLFAHSKHGFYHDGRYKTLGQVVDHYNSCFNLGLTAGQRSDLVQYLKSL